MSETTAPTHNPEHEWADLLRGLSLPQRKAVLSTLQQSAVSGWPATREAVESLVAYAAGRITSKEYAAQTLVALGYADIQTANALLATSPVTPPVTSAPSPDSTGRFDAGRGYDFLFER